MAPVLTVGIAEEVQAGLIALMKASPEMMSAVNGQEIREDDWMSRNFKFPAYRLQILTLGPDTSNNGECRPFINVVRFTVLCFGEGGSSLNCLKLMDIARKALVNRQFKTALFTPVTRIMLPDSGMIMPVPESERGWRGEVQLVMTVKEL